MADETPPMDDTRLAEIRERSAHPHRLHLIGDGMDAHHDRVMLLAEVERLRARVAAARIEIAEGINELVQSVLESSYPLDMLPVDHARLALVNIDKRLARASALLSEGE